MNVLVAEDDPVSRRRLQAILQRWGFQVTATADGAQALEALDQPNRPELAILDWDMPHVDGLEVCRTVRKSLTGPYIYVILLTSHGRDEDLIAGFEAGADDYITKPFKIFELQARIRTGERIADLQKQLAEAAMHDSLTGLLNRRAFFELFQKEVALAKRQKSSLALVMADLDHFKQVNDHYGHLAGDAVLREATRRLRATVRTTDAVGRYGGEEFVAALPGCSLKEAVNIAERFRECIAADPFEIPSGDQIDITTSVGLATTWDMAEAGQLLDTADEALYRAKGGGRNRVEADLRRTA